MRCARYFSPELPQSCLKIRFGVSHMLLVLFRLNGCIRWVDKVVFAEHNVLDPMPISLWNYPSGTETAKHFLPSNSLSSQRKIYHRVTLQAKKRLADCYLWDWPAPPIQPRMTGSHEMILESNFKPIRWQNSKTPSYHISVLCRLHWTRPVCRGNSGAWKENWKVVSTSMVTPRTHYPEMKKTQDYRILKLCEGLFTFFEELIYIACFLGFEWQLRSQMELKYR